jgi:alpha,alpha-trehalase
MKTLHKTQAEIRSASSATSGLRPNPAGISAAGGSATPGIWELILAETAAVCGDDSEIDLYQQRAAARKEAVQRFCWDPTYGFYYDFNFTKGVNTGRITLAAAATLFFGLATAEQANSIKDWLASQFLRAGGMTTTIIRTGQQWDGPNGWAPLQWLAYKGLLRYGFNELAERARISWVGLNERTYEQTGKMMEKYNVMDQDVLAGGGEYPNQDGFGWTNGVYLAMIQENQG